MSPGGQRAGSGQDQREGAALAGRAGYFDSAAVSLGNGLGDTEAKAGTAPLGLGFGGAEKTGKNFFLFNGAKTDTGVYDADSDLLVVCLQGEGDTASGLSIFDGIIHQIEEHPLQMLPIRGNKDGRGDIAMQGNGFLCGQPLQPSRRFQKPVLSGPPAEGPGEEPRHPPGPGGAALPPVD